MIEIDLILDVVCPWCFLGKRQLDKAISERAEGSVSVRLRAYQLSPDAPVEGTDRAAYYKKKFGDGPELQQARAYMREKGSALGINFDFEREALIANTLDAHRVIRWALAPGKQLEVADEIMHQYFEQGAFLGDHELLADIASAEGMDRDLLLELLASDRDKDLVTKEAMEAGQMGVRGVPFYIFDGKVALSGAQDPETITEVLDRMEAGEDLTKAQSR